MSNIDSELGGATWLEDEVTNTYETARDHAAALRKSDPNRRHAVIAREVAKGAAMELVMARTRPAAGWEHIDAARALIARAQEHLRQITS